MINAATALASSLTTMQHVAPKPTKEQIDAQAQYMIDMGYNPIDPAAHRKIAAFLAYRKIGSARKGLLLSGNSGTGKTMAATLFLCRRVVSAASVAAKWLDSPDDAREMVILPQYDSLPIGYNDVCIDDLGDEPKVNRFGTKVEVMKESICHLYIMYQRVQCKVYVTTNITPAEIAERYGSRVMSRLSEMCTFVEFKAPDQRQTGGF